MNADRLLEVYEQISEAPDAIARLRRFVLDLALRGKLVEQNPSDEPAAELIAKIATEKEKKAAAGSKAKVKAVSSGSLVDHITPPQGWEIVPLGGLINGHLGGGTPSKSNPAYWDGDIRWASVKDVGKTKYVDDTIDRITEEGLAASSSNFIPEGNLIVVTRMGLGQLSINRVPVAINQDLRALFLSSFIDIDYIYNFFLTYSLEGTGLTVKGIKLNELMSIAVPLPPLAEQHRIVAKVYELMALCDRLEEARRTREEMRDKLTAASLARLTAPDTTRAEAEPGKVGTGFPSGSATTEDDFPTHANFALEALPALTTRPDQIKTLRQTILNLAVRGKLLGNVDGSFEPVGKFRKLQNGYAFKSGWFSKSGVRLLRNANIGHGEIRWDDTAYLPEEMAAEYERFRLHEGDIVLTLDRPFIVTGTKVARVSRTDLPSLLLQRVGRFVETGTGLSDTYLFMWINSPHFNDQIDPGRSNGVPHISSKQVEAAEIFVPPLAEQHRIVAKVDALMALCDRLEAALTTTDTNRTRLFEALLHEALELGDQQEKAA